MAALRLSVAPASATQVPAESVPVAICAIGPSILKVPDEAITVPVLFICTGEPPPDILEITVPADLRNVPALLTTP
jgi:hypothetical protein